MKHFLYIIILYSLFNPEYLNISEEELFKERSLFRKHSWLNYRLYNLYKYRSIQYKVPLRLAMCVIETESKGRNRRSIKQNRNGSYDWGRMQINEIHLKNNPKKLLNDKINSKYGFYYLSKCSKKSIGFIPDTIRYYNQGINGKIKNYKNWKYVRKVLMCLN